MAIVTAMRGDAVATRRALLDVDLTEIPVWARHLGHGCGVLEGWSSAVLGDADGPQRAIEALERLEPVSTQVLRACQRTFAGAALLHHDDPAAVAVRERAHCEAVAARCGCPRRCGCGRTPSGRLAMPRWPPNCSPKRAASRPLRARVLIDRLAVERA